MIEIFHWMNIQIDISKVLAHVSTGKVRPKKEVLDIEFINAYAKQVLCLNLEEGRIKLVEVCGWQLMPNMQ